MSRVIPARAMADSFAARPAVKFRFTGTLSASTSPRFATVAPRPGGSTTPTRFSGTLTFSHCEKTMPAASSSPPLSDRLANVSVMTGWRKRLRRPRMHSMPRCERSSGRAWKAVSDMSSIRRRTVSAVASSLIIGAPK